MTEPHVHNTSVIATKFAAFRVVEHWPSQWDRHNDTVWEVQELVTACGVWVDLGRFEAEHAALETQGELLEAASAED